MNSKPLLHHPTNQPSLMARFIGLTIFTALVLFGLQLASPTSAGATTAADDDRLTVGDRFACAIDIDGQAFCWGWSTVGQLGNGSGEGHGGRAYPTPSAVPGVFNAAAISAGDQHACALLRDGRVLCWGAGLDGQLGDGGDRDSFEPVEVLGLGDAVAISAGGDATCALRQTGTVVCWGDNRYGQMGDGTDEDSIRPSTVANLTDAVSIDMTADTGCSARRDGSVVCWGYNSFGQIDPALEHDVRLPVTVATLSNAIDAVSSTSHGVCALRSDGVIHCTNAGDPFHAPDVSSMSADDELCVIATNGALVCNEFATSVAVGDFIDLNLTPSVDVEVGNDSACAALGDGTVACWGSNRWGQLGAGHTDPVLGPITVNGLFLGTSGVQGPSIQQASTLDELTRSADFRPEHGDVLRLYRAFFDREPDLDGAKYWLARFDDGLTLHQITSSFASSPEFRTIYGDLTTREYVLVIYQNVLDRSPDAEGFAFWLGRLQAGDLDRASVMLQFSLSPEFRSNHPYPG